MGTAGCLTVKHIESNGYECVVQATNVAFIPQDACHQDDPRPRAEVIAYGAPYEGGAFMGGVGRFSGGLIYVMNEAGATVSRYDLDWLNRDRSKEPKAA